MKSFLLLVIAACGSAASDPQPEPEPEPERTIDKARLQKLLQAHDRVVDVFVDRDRVAVIELDTLHTALRIDLLTKPIKDWASIELRGDGVGPTQWLEPGKNFKSAVPLLYLEGKNAAVGLFDPAKRSAASGGNGALLHETGIDEIRITLAKPTKSPLEQLALGCADSKTELLPPIPEKWHGTTHQFNLDVYWMTSLSIKLGTGAVGAHIGVMSQTDSYGKLCVYDIYRQPDRNNRRSAHAVLRAGPSCVDGLLEFVCNGQKLELFSHYTLGEYVEHGLLTADPIPKKKP